MPRLSLARLLDILLILTLAVYVLLGVSLTPFHADEATQIAMSRDFFIQFVDGDYQRLRYDPAAPLTAEMQLRLINGTISKTLMGFAWFLRGGTADTLSGDWDWGADWNYNVSTGRYPPPEVLLAARLPSALFLAGGVPLMFALGWTLGGRPAAWGAAILFAIHPILLLNGRRAMMEGSLIFFSLLTVCAAIWFARRRSWASALLLGAACGLTIASKHTGAAVVAAVFAGLAIEWLYRLIAALTLNPSPPRRAQPGDRAGIIGATGERGSPRSRASRQSPSPPSRTDLLPTRTASGDEWESGMRGEGVLPRSPLHHLAQVIRLLAAALLVLVVFFVLNPAWWGGDPLLIGRTILEWRQELITAQAADHQGYRDTTTQLLGFAQMSFGDELQYFEVTGWSEIPEVRAQIAAYEESPWVGWRWGTAGAALVLFLSIAGLFALLRDPKLTLAERLIMLMWVIVSVFITFVSPLAWQRYYLPIYPPVLLLAVYAPFGLRRVWEMWAEERRKKAGDEARGDEVMRRKGVM